MASQACNKYCNNSFPGQNEAQAQCNVISAAQNSLPIAPDSQAQSPVSSPQSLGNSGPILGLALHLEFFRSSTLAGNVNVNVNVEFENCTGPSLPCLFLLWSKGFSTNSSASAKTWVWGSGNESAPLGWSQICHIAHPSSDRYFCSSSRHTEW